MHRRTFLRAAAIAAIASPPLAPRALALGQAPAASAETGAIAGLPARVAGVDPRVLLDALRAMPVTTPILPADTPPVAPVIWDDDSDSDLAGTLGGVIFAIGADDNDIPLLVGTAIVHPDADAAAGVLASTSDRTPGSFLGLPWVTQVEPDFAASVARVDYLLLVGGAELPAEGEPVTVDDTGSPPAGASPVAAAGSPSLELRAISHLTALLDHLGSVLAALGA